MNRRRLLFIGILALTLGALVAFKVYRSLQAKIMPAAVGVDVLVAANNIAVGAKLADNDLKIVQIPSEAVPPAAFHSKERAVGRGVVLPIIKGDFVLPNKLAGENAGYGLPALIPPGMRAVPVRVNEVIGVSGWVTPGTRVDVLLTGNSSGASEQQTTTVLYDIAVIANGKSLERTSAGEPQTSTVITLLVSPDDAQKLTLASTQGKIQLALRNPLDTRQQELAPVRTDALYKNAPTPVLAVPRPKTKRSTAPAAPAPKSPQFYDVDIIRGSQTETTHLKQ